MLKYSADLEGRSSNSSSWLTSWNWASFSHLYNEDIGPYTWFPTCGCLQNKLLWRMWVTDSLQLLPLWIRSHIYTSGCTQPVTEHGRGLGVGPVRASSHGQVWLRASPSADQDYTLVWDSSLSNFLRSLSQDLHHDVKALLPTPAHIPFNFVEITQYIFAHVTLSLSSATQRTRTDNSILSRRVRKMFQSVWKFQVQ